MNRNHLYTLLQLLFIGIHHKIKFHFCSCYNEAVTLIKLGFFPATPKQLEVAFQFQLLDLLEALLLECQVAIKDFTNALECQTNCPLLVCITKLGQRSVMIIHI